MHDLHVVNGLGIKSCNVSLCAAAFNLKAVTDTLLRLFLPAGHYSHHHAVGVADIRKVGGLRSFG